MITEVRPGTPIDPIYEREQAFDKEAHRFDGTINAVSFHDADALQAGYARLEELTADDFGFGCDGRRLYERYRALHSYAHSAFLKASEIGDEDVARLFRGRIEELWVAIGAINKPIANMRARVEERRIAEQSPRQ